MDENPETPIQTGPGSNPAGVGASISNRNAGRGRWIKVTFGFGIAAALLVGGYFLLGHILVGQILDERRVRDIDVAQWEKIRIGMTKREVTDLIGVPPKISPASHITVTDKVGRKKEGRTTETWQYRWADPMAPMMGYGASPKAYALWFDDSGKLIQLRKPEEMDLAKKDSSKHYILEDPGTVPLWFRPNF